MENKIFKKSIFGGFKKSDVMDYIKNLESEKNKTAPDEELTKEVEELRKEKIILLHELEKANEQIKKLSDPLTGANRMIASSIKHSKDHFDSMVSLADQINDETSNRIESISCDVENMLGSTAEMADKFEQSLSELRSKLDNLKNNLNQSKECFNGGNEKPSDEIMLNAENQNNDIYKILSDGYELLDETTLQQFEITKIINDLKSKYY